MIEFATAKTLEFLFFFGLIAAFGIWQLRQLSGLEKARLEKRRAEGPYRPPAPDPLPPTRALLRAIATGNRDLLSLVPDEAYRRMLMPLGLSRRSILVVNDPKHVTHVLNDPEGIFPKNDLMVGALEGLVGRSLFVASGDDWRRQRRMIEPAFSHMRVDRAFQAMAAAIADRERHLDDLAARGEPFSLDAAMSHLTADIVYRTIFSEPLASATARAVFDDFLVFERACANVDIPRLLFAKPFARIAQPESVRAACERIRAHIGAMVDVRMAPGATRHDDIAQAVIDARDPETGEGFTREELIDQIGVFFLAGHETTASVLTWVFFILSRRPETAERLRAEITAIAGEGEITIEATKRLAFVRNVFRETARLYPPITFIPRVATRATRIGPYAVKRGAMIMIAPWTIHRHEKIWADADRFDPDRFAAPRETQIPPGAYLPFGQGPRICVGAAFATVEATLIIARLLRRYDVETLAPETVMPIARLSTRPATEIMVRVRRRAATPAVVERPALVA